MPVGINRKLAATALAAVAALAVAVAPATGTPAAKPKPRIVTVSDDLFTPGTLTVAKNKLVKWNWDPANTDTHDVTLKSGPKGVNKKDFKSADGSIGIRFERRLAVPGTYKFICTLHPTVMKLTITVNK